MAGRLTLSTLNNDTGPLATQNGMTGIAKAWVNFNGSTAAIRSSFNVGSITKHTTGEYTVNFTTALADANYTVSGTAMYPSSTNSHFISLGDANGASGTIPTTTSFRFRTLYTVTQVNAQDCSYVCISVSGS
jgi:hypothetical protein